MFYDYNSLFPVISLSKKKENFWEFSGILERFWRILDISKRILEYFPGNSGKNFRSFFGNYVAKPSEARHTPSELNVFNFCAEDKIRQLKTRKILSHIGKLCDEA